MKIIMKTTFNKILNISLVLISLIVFGGKAWGAYSTAPAGTYNLVTDASTLSAGDVIIIAGTNSGTTKAISTTQNGNNRGAVEVTLSNNSITLTAENTVQGITLEAGTTSGTFSFNTGDGYLYAASSGSNYLRTEATKSANSSWDITISDGLATVNAQGTNTRSLMRYNHSNSPSVFSCYATTSTTGVLVNIYKKAASGYTVDFAVNTAGYGTVSPSAQLKNIASGTAITKGTGANVNQVTVNGTTVTATPHAQDADYNYAFSNWSVTDNLTTVTKNITITANFTRTERALTNYRTKCCTPLASINGSFNCTNNSASARVFSWANESTATDVEHYELSYKQKNLAGDPSVIKDDIANDVSSYTHTANLTQGTTYTYYLTAVGASGHCDATEEVDVTIPYDQSTVTFNANGATGGDVPDDIVENTGTTVYVPDNTGELVKTHYAFDGWNTQEDGEGDDYSVGDDFTLSGNLTLYAKWACAEYVNVLKGSPSNGSFTISTGSKYTCDEAAVVSVTGITPSEGYRFKEITQTSLASGVTIDQTNKTVTYAQYANGNSTINVTFEQIPVYTITWSVNGTTNTTEVVDGNALVLPSDPANDGCEDGKAFVGWTATAIVGSTDTKPGDVFTTASGAPAIDDDKTFYAVFATPGVEGEEETDVLTRATTGVSNGSTTYSAWSNKTVTTDAVYAGKSAGDHDAIQLRTSGSDEGVVTTTSGGKAKKVTVVWESNTANGRTVNVYGKNSAYSSAADLFGDDKGTLLGSIVYGTSTELTITDNYEYIGIRSSSSALYLSSVSIKWETVAGTAESGYITSCTKQVAVTATAGGSATIDGGAVANWVDEDTEMALVATPNEGYVFAGWTYESSGTVVINEESNPTTTVTTDGAATITANFVAGSTITADQESLALVAYVGEPDEATVTFTSSNAPQYGSVYYEITDWTDTEDTYITAAPALTYPISTTSLDETVTISYGSDVAGSFSANLVATAYNTNNLVVGTKVIPITLTIKPKFTVTVAGEHATTKSASPNTDVKDGQTVTLSQTAADDWVFQKWTISYTLNAVAYNEDLDGNTFTMPAANVTATAVYTEKSGTDLTAPTNATAGSITSHSAALSWDAVDHASSYSIYIYGSDESENTIDGITTNSYTLTGLKAEIDYVWTVTAIGDGVNYYTSSAADGAEFTTTARILSSIAIKTPATKMSYNEGETFVKTGLEVTATYDDETTATISAASLVVTDEPLTAGTTSITVSYTENKVTKEATLTGITVNELGSVTWSANGVTNVVKYAEGQAISFPPSASGCFGKSFVGWSESTIDGETDDAPTLVTSATMGATNKTYYAVFAILEENDYEKSYGFEDSEPDASFWTVSGPVKDNGKAATGSYAGKINTNNTYVTFKNKVNVTNFSFNFARTSNNDSYNVYIETSADGETWTAVKTVAMSTFDRYGTFSSVSQDFDGENALYVRFRCSNTTAVRYVDDVHIEYSATTGSKYATSCCTPYTVTISDAIEHGSVSTGEVTSACEGTEITLSSSADDGYEFDAWTVMQGESDITESNVEGNVLTMPAGNVTVSASFNKIAVESVTINGEANVQINNDVVWTLEITPNTARPTVVWSTANDAVATVNNGTVHGVAVGSTTITATVDGTPYNKTINVIRETKLNSLTVVDPKTAYTLNEAFVAPQVNANYVYVDDESAAPSIEDVAAEFTGFDNLNAGNQTITVSYGGKSTTYDVAVAAWTLKLQTKRMYGNDEEKATVVDATITTLEAPTALNGYYVTGLCEGYTQLGYITSSENIDAEPAEVLTEYTPSANNETLYGVFQKTNYAGVDVLTEDFSSQETFNANFPVRENTVTFSEGSVRLGSGNYAGSMTSKELDLSHKFKVEISAKRYSSDNNVTLYVKVGSTPSSQENLPSSYPTNPYVFEFNGSTTNKTVQIYTSAKDKRIDIESIHIYTLSDVEYTSVYDCREEKDVEYVINNDKVVWTACENTTVMEGQSYTLCANEPSLQGYDFGGWIINGDEENTQAAGTTIEVAEDLTITPKFTEHIYDYSYALAATATNGTIASVTVNGVAKALNEVELHDGDAVVVTATPNTNYELSEWTHSENIASLTTDGNTASFTVAENASDMTIAAIFTEKAQYTMTLNVFGRTYTTKQGHEGDTYSSVLDGAQSPALTGYTFQGWSTDADDADAIITGEELLTADVTLYAIVGSSQPTGYVYNKVTSMDDVTDDGYYLIVNEDANKAFDASRNSSSDLDAINNYVNVTVNENQIISNSTIDAAVVTIVAIPETDPQKHYIKTATGYYIGNNGSNGLLANTTTVYNNALSFNDGNFVVNSGAKKDNVDMVLRYNNSSNKFGYYKGTQEPIQLYKRGDVHEEIIPEAEPEVVISTAVTASTSYPGGYVGDMTVVNGGSLNADINLSVGDLIIHSTLGKGTGTGNGSGNNPGNCGQVINGNNITVTGDVYLELELTQDAAASAGWYAFSVPFPVDAMNGVYYGDTKLQNEVGYAIMSHYGDLRAENKYAWKKFRGIMEPGVFYVITVGHTNYKTLRFKKVAGEALVASSSVAVSPFPTQTGNNADGAWNGIGNPNLAISNLATSFSAPMQFYDHKTNSFTSRNHSMNLVVGSAFFIQYDATSTVSIPVGTTSHNGYLAPQRERNADEDAIYEVSLTNMTTGEMEDNLFLTAREDATNEYEIGRDLAKMSMGTAKCAQMWVPAYGTKLCAADFPLVNSKATYPLMINTVQAGTYTIEQVRPQENAELYLTKNGHIIWNLTMSPCELELTQGQNEGYGLILRANAPSVSTDVEGIQPSADSIQKVIIDEKVFILRGGKMYGVDGKEVR